MTSFDAQKWLLYPRLAVQQGVDYPSKAYKITLRAFPLLVKIYRVLQEDYGYPRSWETHMAFIEDLTYKVLQDLQSTPLAALFAGPPADCTDLLTSSSAWTTWLQAAKQYNWEAFDDRRDWYYGPLLEVFEATVPTYTGSRRPQTIAVFGHTDLLTVMVGDYTEQAHLDAMLDEYMGGGARAKRNYWAEFGCRVVKPRAFQLGTTALLLPFLSPLGIVTTLVMTGAAIAVDESTYLPPTVKGIFSLATAVFSRNLAGVASAALRIVKSETPAENVQLHHRVLPVLGLVLTGAQGVTALLDTKTAVQALYDIKSVPPRTVPNLSGGLLGSAYSALNGWRGVATLAASKDQMAADTANLSAVADQHTATVAAQKEPRENRDVPDGLIITRLATLLGVQLKLIYS